MICQLRCESESGWSDLVSMDGGYENRVQESGGVVRKRYGRAERFEAERTALRVFGDAGLAPRLLEVCEQHRCILMGQVAGTPLQAHADDRTWIALGALVAVLHRGGAGFARDREPIDHFEERARSLPEELQDGVLLWSAGQWRTEDARTLLHGDLKPANVLVSDQPRLIDFDQSRVGHPFSDLGKLTWRAAPVGSSAWEGFAVGYFPTPPTDTDLRLIESFRVRHAIGGLAYWCDFRRPGFAAHARSAAAIVAAALGADLSDVLIPLGLEP